MDPFLLRKLESVKELFVKSELHIGFYNTVVIVILINDYHLINMINVISCSMNGEIVRALNSIFQQWEKQAADTWNHSGEPCSGLALSQSDSVLEDPSNNPTIRCDCSFNSNTVCHITRLKQLNTSIRRVVGLDTRGVLPVELLDLPFLNFLKIDQNFFSGPLPAFIGNMSRLGLLSMARNVFSGPIPKELGNLKELYLLSLSNNNLSGTLPPELGNLVNLEQLYINSCGLGGQIPSTFANLVNLQIVRAVDIAFTGKIPDFVGNNWTKLTSLRFQGNSFEGPIPSSLANLTSLNSLRIGDIYNGGSSLYFVRNLKNLTDLVLRNVLLTGILPSYITELQSLQKLDLSFNNLTGTIPSALFTMNSLQDLFLGNNSLLGAIPSQKSETLRNMNLVANNFTLNSSSLRLFPGLECLQRSFPCFRNAPRLRTLADANFSIKCGGRQMISDGITFEADNSAFGAATFNMTSTQKWAVSNVGLFADRLNQLYVENYGGQVRRTNTPELYQTSRLSPGSLRYYGLGLENGLYTVKLFFAETGFEDRISQSWRSLGRRIFDVYIQGNQTLREFDISKEAGGVQRAITPSFIANVTENHLEIHLFWAGKGTCCTPEQGYYGPSISAISVTPNFRPSVSGIPPENPKEKKNRTAMIAGVTVSGVALALILMFAIMYLKRKSKDDDEEVLLGIGPRPNTFSYSELKAATEDFSPSKKLGEGGFGPVYKGTLNDGRVVAVKQLSVASNQGKDQFITEIATISAVQHRNLVKLYGCCIEGNRRLLVYEYLENKSLDKALFGRNDLHLDWPTRFNICLSTARGLAYLHEDSRARIVHRDVKASNILLDAELCPKISDFGFAKLYDDKKTHISTRVAGTIQLLSLLDPILAEFDENEALRVIGVALLCTQSSPSMRPPMSRVVAMLAGDIEVSSVTSKPSYITDWYYKDITGSFMNKESQTSNASDHSGSDIKSKNETTSNADDQPMLLPVNITNFRESIGEGR
ncbi:hypothetical protein V6N12_023448 [Hibiscus sabdariffa]|uniref:non-specific serine/threonine protein kinase n=1 Tax=Hibiscus sabdariffa TaxID=183260 RepID=A0ABR2FXP8_9ROSI